MENDLKKLVGQKLQLLRQEKNISQEEMSERLNLSLSAYRKIEYGDTDITLTRLNKIAEIFDMPAMELFSRIDGNTQFNNCQHFIGYAQHNNTVNLSNPEDLRALIKANAMLIEMMDKRIQTIGGETARMISFPEIGLIVGIAVVLFGCKAVSQNPFISRQQKILWMLTIVVLNWIGLLWYYYTFYMRDKDE